MTKNMTRKGLAFGAGASLLAASLVGLPAQAANEELITLSESAGSGWNVIAGSDFDIRATLDSSVPSSNYTQLRWRIENSDETEIQAKMIGGGADTGATTDPLVDYAADSDVNADAVGLSIDSIANDGTDIHFGYVDSTGVLTFQLGADVLETGDLITFDGLDMNLDDSATDEETKLDALVAHLNATEFVVTRLSANTFTITVTDTTILGNDVDYADADFTTADSTTASTVANVVVSDNVQAINTTRSDDFTVEPATSDDAAAGSPVSLILDVQDLTVETTVVVTAFLDLDGSNTISGSEVVSAPQEITFIPGNSVSASVAFKQPLIGDTTLYGLIAFENDVNEAQVDTGAAHLKGAFSGDADTDTIVSYAYSTLLGGFISAANTAAAGEDYTVEIFTDTTGDTDAADPDASVDITGTGGSVTGADNTAEDTSTSSVGVVEANVFTISLTEGDGVIVSEKAVNNVGGTATEYTDATGAATIREGVESITVTGFVGTDAATPLPVKNRTVSVTLTPANVTSGDDLELNGTDVTGSAAVTETTTTSTKGIWSMVINTAGLDDADELAIEVLVDNVSSDDSSDNASNGVLTVTVDKADYTLLDTTDVTGQELRTIEAGDTVTMSYQMVDQWGDAPDNGEYRVAISDLSNNRATTAADFAVSSSVVDGLVSLTFTDNGVGTGYTDVRAQLGLTAGALSTSSGEFITTRVYVVADSAVDSITLEDLVYGSAQYVEDTTTDNREKLLLEDKAFGAYDANQAVPGAEAPEVDSTYVVTMAGTVANAADAGLDGAVVTVSGSGLQFLVGSVYTVDSAAFVVDGDGDFSVDVWSQIGGTRTVTITSGGVSQTVALPYAGAAAGSEDSLTVAPVASITPGSTTNVVATVKDDLGNGVEGITVQFATVIGYMAQAEVTTDANGVAIGKLVTSVADKGNTAVTVSIPGNDDVAAVSQTVGVGQSADQKVNAGSFKGYVALYAKGYEGQRMSAKVGKDWVIVAAIPAATNDLFRAVEFVGAGVEISVRLYIDRVLIDTIPLLTK